MTAGPLGMVEVAAAIGGPARGRMLGALMGGRALTATELSLEACIAPSTASSHLARLQRAGLICAVAQGRHRYFRLASQEVAALLETLLGLGAARGGPDTGPREPGLRRARVCYDHLAGEVAVRIFERMREQELLCHDTGLLTVSAAGERWLSAIGIDVEELGKRPRPLLRTCLDWSERRDHLAGAVGAALLERLLALRLARRREQGRALALSARGEAFASSLRLS